MTPAEPAVSPYQRNPQNPQILRPEVEAEVEFFAGDDEGGFDFAVPDGDSEWRVEKRYYTKKDGQDMVYWNYRARAGFVDENGKRIVPYKKGGKQNA